MGKNLGIGTLFLLLMAGLLAGCGQEMPFNSQYLSANQVRIDYNGASYTLNRYGPKIPAPFDYQFESDGDLNITIAGKTWDIDSPYDVSGSTSKKKKKKKKKTSKKKSKKKK